MASIIRVKRSTGTLAPATLNYGELGLTIGVGTHGNKGGRLFAGDNASNAQIIGGRYYTDLLSIEPGKVAGQVNPTTIANGFVPIVDQNEKVDRWNVDNLRLDGNAITSTNVDGNITITPNGSGRIQILDDDELQFGTSDDIRFSYDSAKDALFIERGSAGNSADVRIADDIHLQFGTDNDARIYYDESGVDRVLVEGASWTYKSSVNQVLVDATTSSTNSTTGALVVTGGVGVGGDVNINGDLAVQGGDVTSLNSDLNLFNASVNRANVLGAATNILIGATTGVTTIRNATVDLDGDLNIDGGDLTSNQSSFNLLTQNVNVADVLTSATNVVFGATTGVTTIRNATVDLSGDLNIDGGDLTSNQTSFNLLTTNVNNANVLSAATNVVFGATTGITTIRNASVDLDGDLNIDGGDLTSNQTSFNLLTTNVNNTNVLSVASNISLGATTGVTTIRNATVDLDGDLNIDGGDLTSNQTSFNLLTTNVEVADVLLSATNISLGATTGIVTIRNASVDLDGDLNIDGGDLTSNQTSFNLLTTNVNNANVLSAATNVVFGATTGITTIRNATVDLDGDLNIDGGDLTSNQTSFNLLTQNVNVADVLTSATNILIGATTGITTIRNAGVDLDGDLNIDGGDLTSNQTSFNLLTQNVNVADVLTSATNILLGSTSGIATIRNATVDLDGDLNIDGGDLTSNQTSFNLLTQNVNNANVLLAASNISFGATTGITTIRNASVDLDGHLNVDNSAYVTGIVTSTESIVSPLFDSSNINLLPPTIGDYSGERLRLYDFNNPTNTNYAIGVEGNHIWFGVDNYGENQGFKWYGETTQVMRLSAVGNLTLEGNIAIKGGNLTSNQSTFNLLTQNVNVANVLTSASNILIGATTGITTIRNATIDIPNATTLSLGSSSQPTTVTFSSTNNTSYISVASTNNATSTTSGALRVAGGVGIVSDVHIGGQLIVAGININDGGGGGDLNLTGNLTVSGNTTLGNNANTDFINITGIVTHTGAFTNVGGMVIDNIGISSNVISTKSGGGNILYIDPYPDGLSNEGTVIIKGDLQVDGTTTTVNSTTVSLNDAILTLGDVTSSRTVTQTVGTGVSAITLDSVTGINTGDLISGSPFLPGSGITTINSYNTSTKVVYIEGLTTGGISTETQLTITHAYDTNTDRGISFDYNTGVGANNNKVGFFGYHDTTNVGSFAPARSWTYIPDATITNSVVEGIRGYLDIKGIYYQTGDYNTHGVTYFDENGLQTSTNNPNTASNTRTSTQILTAVTEITLELPSSYSVIAGQQITQLNNSAAYGVVKTTNSGTTITLIGVQGVFDTTNDLKVEGSNISIIPSTVNTIYTNKPMWTDTIDGGTF